MENTARDELMMQAFDDLSQHHQTPESSECDIVPFSPQARQRDSLFENFVDEIDAWARHAIALNGFGDY